MQLISGAADKLIPRGGGGKQFRGVVSPFRFFKTKFFYKRFSAHVKIFAFTLAETLTTLAIIGVVAAMTIPAVLHHHRKTVIETRLLKFYSNINEAVRLSEIDNGNQLEWDPIGNYFATDEDGNYDYSKPLIQNWYETYLAPYLNTLRVEYESGSLTAGKVLIFFADGSLCVMAANSTIFYPVAQDYYTGNYTAEKGRDTELSGIKYFDFLFTNSNKASNVYGMGVQPYIENWDGTREDLLENSELGCKNSVTNERAYCTKLIQDNGWKIPDDYFYQF